MTALDGPATGSGSNHCDRTRARIRRSLAVWSESVMWPEVASVPPDADGFAEVGPATADEWRALAAAWGIGGLNRAEQRHRRVGQGRSRVGARAHHRGGPAAAVRGRRPGRRQPAPAGL